MVTSDDKTAEALFPKLDDDRREVRLLRLERSTDRGNSIVCQHVAVALDLRPSFEAISWCWGTRQETKTISLNAQPYEAPCSVVTLLQALRLPDSDRYLWIDALCIDQRDEDKSRAEKSQQIQLMKYIYSLATAVLIWMGDAPEDVATFITSVMNDTQASIAWATQQPFEMMSQMTGILLLPWWHRLWVFPEAVLASEAICVFGRATISFSAVLQHYWIAPNHFSTEVRSSESYQILSQLIADIIDRFGTVLSSHRGVAAEHRRELSFASMGQIKSDSYQNRKEPFNDFTKIISQYRYLQTTDPRDKIWGFLGLATDPVIQALKPDYNLPAHLVFRQTTRQLMQRTGSLYLLSQRQSDYIELSHRTSTSWVPDWTSLNTTNRIDIEWRSGPARQSREGKFDACLGMLANTRPELMQASSDTALHVEGLLYCYISTAGVLGPTRDLADWWHQTRTWRDAYDDATKVHDKRGQKAPFFGLAGKSKCSPIRQYLKWRNFWDIMTQGTAPSTFPRDLSIAGDMWHAYGVTDNDAGDTLFNLCCMDAGFHLGGYPDKTTNLRRLLYDPSVRLRETELYPHLKRTTTGQCFFTSLNTPAVGIGPSALQNFDEIWVLAGAKYPVALRPIKPYPGIVFRHQYLFVGEVYLNSPRPDLDVSSKTSTDEDMLSQINVKLKSAPMHGGIVRAAQGEESRPGRHDLYKWRPQPITNGPGFCGKAWRPQPSSKANAWESRDTNRPADETKRHDPTDLAYYLHELELY